MFKLSLTEELYFFLFIYVPNMTALLLFFHTALEITSYTTKNYVGTSIIPTMWNKSVRVLTSQKTELVLLY